MSNYSCAVHYGRVGWYLKSNLIFLIENYLKCMQASAIFNVYI